MKNQPTACFITPFKKLLISPDPQQSIILNNINNQSFAFNQNDSFHRTTQYDCPQPLLAENPRQWVPSQTSKLNTSAYSTNSLKFGLQQQIVDEEAATALLLEALEYPDPVSEIEKRFREIDKAYQEAERRKQGEFSALKQARDKVRLKIITEEDLKPLKDQSQIAHAKSDQLKQQLQLVNCVLQTLNISSVQSGLKERNRKQVIYEQTQSEQLAAIRKIEIIEAELAKLNATRKEDAAVLQLAAEATKALLNATNRFRILMEGPISSLFATTTTIPQNLFLEEVHRTEIEAAQAELKELAANAEDATKKAKQVAQKRSKIDDLNRQRKGISRERANDTVRTSKHFYNLAANAVQKTALDELKDQIQHNSNILARIDALFNRAQFANLHAMNDSLTQLRNISANTERYDSLVRQAAAKKYVDLYIIRNTRLPFTSRRLFNVTSRSLFNDNDEKNFRASQFRDYCTPSAADEELRRRFVNEFGDYDLRLDPLKKVPGSEVAALKMLEKDLLRYGNSNSYVFIMMEVKERLPKARINEVQDPLTQALYEQFQQKCPSVLTASCPESVERLINGTLQKAWRGYGLSAGPGDVMTEIPISVLFTFADDENIRQQMDKGMGGHVFNSMGDRDAEVNAETPEQKRQVSDIASEIIRVLEKIAEGAGVKKYHTFYRSSKLFNDEAALGSESPVKKLQEYIYKWCLKQGLPPLVAMYVAIQDADQATQQIIHGVDSKITWQNPDEDISKIREYEEKTLAELSEKLNERFFDVAYARLLEDPGFKALYSVIKEQYIKLGQCSETAKVSSELPPLSVVNIAAAYSRTNTGESRIGAPYLVRGDEIPSKNGDDNIPKEKRDLGVILLSHSQDDVNRIVRRLDADTMNTNALTSKTAQNMLQYLKNGVDSFDRAFPRYRVKPHPSSDPIKDLIHALNKMIYITKDVDEGYEDLLATEMPLELVGSR